MRIPVSFGNELWFTQNPMLQDKIFQDMAPWIARFRGDQHSLEASFAWIIHNYEHSAIGEVYFPDLTDKPRPRLVQVPPVMPLPLCRMN